MYPLAQLALASVGASRYEILTAIGLRPDTDIKQVFSDVNMKRQSVKGVELKQANKIYVKEDYTLNKTFAALSKSLFNSEVQNINFENSQEAADEINKWVEANTNKRIKNLVDPSTITNTTDVVLVSAIFFKGKWTKSFDKSVTKEHDFFVTKDKNVTISMMHKSDRFKYGESDELDAKLLEMSYEGGETSFVVVLPKKSDGIKSLVKKLKNPEAFSKGLSTMSETNVHVSMPKFKIETTTDLKEVLEKINIRLIFKNVDAHLDNLVEGEKMLSVSGAVQKAFIEVDEKGTEAAAANALPAILRPAYEIPYESFEADHPFVFYLIHQNITYFNGVFQS